MESAFSSPFGWDLGHTNTPFPHIQFFSWQNEKPINSPSPIGKKLTFPSDLCYLCTFFPPLRPRALLEKKLFKIQEVLYVSSRLWNLLGELAEQTFAFPARMGGKKEPRLPFAALSSRRRRQPRLSSRERRRRRVPTSTRPGGTVEDDDDEAVDGRYAAFRLVRQSLSTLVCSHFVCALSPSLSFCRFGTTFPSWRGWRWTQKASWSSPREKNKEGMRPSPQSTTTTTSTGGGRRAILPDNAQSSARKSRIMLMKAVKKAPKPPRLEARPD